MGPMGPMGPEGPMGPPMDPPQGPYVTEPPPGVYGTMRGWHLSINKSANQSINKKSINQSIIRDTFCNNSNRLCSEFF